MQTLYSRFNLCTQRCASRYHAAHCALLAIDPDGLWQSRLKELKDADIQGPGKDDNGSGNSRFEPSWIWLVPRVLSAPDMEDSELALDDSLQVGWAKSWAQKEHWKEEVLIIQEEMRRVIMYQQWRALWWRDQGKHRTDADSATLHGVSAYAEKQASLCKSLARTCAICWLPALKAKGITPDWATIGLLTRPIFHASANENRTLEDEESDEADVKNTSGEALE